MPPVEAWEKVFLSQESFFETVHGRYGCITCHGGTGGTGDIEAAHDGLVPDPASAEACGDCHPDQVAAEADSLHSNLGGYATALSARSAPEHMAQLEEMMVSGDSHVAFVVGGSAGLSDAVLDRADERMSLSRMTLPHQLARVVLFEQVYRAFKIMKGEPYHL